MKQNETVQGILNAIELYAEAGRKASRQPAGYVRNDCRKPSRCSVRQASPLPT